MEYGENDYEPKFDLIIGTQTMQELGIVLDFSTNMIEIDQVKLLMGKIKYLQKPNQVYQMYKNQENLKTPTQMYSKYEPESTKELTNQAIEILDAKYGKRISHKL